MRFKLKDKRMERDLFLALGVIVICTDSSNLKISIVSNV